MDPNATLRELRELGNDGEGPIDMNCADRAAELFRSLDEWLRRGGFLPDDWKGAYARPTFPSESDPEYCDECGVPYPIPRQIKDAVTGEILDVVVV